MPRAPRQRRRKYETDEKYQNRLAEWKFTQSHEAEVKLKGNSIMKKYYTETLLSVYLKVVQNAYLTKKKKAILQKNNDSNYETKGTGSDLARRF